MKVITKVAAKSMRGKNKTIVYGIHPVKTGRHFHGKILIALDDKGICWTGFNCGADRLAAAFPGAYLVEDAKITAAAARDIAKNGPDKTVTPLSLTGTAFQIKVWKALLKIPCGKTVTYGDIARKIGHPDAVRAVGSAVGKNPVTLIVPCHRVVNKTGGRINYGWGAKIKTALLRDEGVTV